MSGDKPRAPLDREAWKQAVLKASPQSAANRLDAVLLGVGRFRPSDLALAEVLLEVLPGEVGRWLIERGWDASCQGFAWRWHKRAGNEEAQVQIEAWDAGLPHTCLDMLKAVGGVEDLHADEVLAEWVRVSREARRFSLPVVVPSPIYDGAVACQRDDPGHVAWDWLEPHMSAAELKQSSSFALVEAGPKGEAQVAAMMREHEVLDGYDPGRTAADQADALARAAGVKGAPVLSVVEKEDDPNE